MDSDNPHDDQPQELSSAGIAPRLPPPVSAMERRAWWIEREIAMIEREISGRMPFPNKAVEAYYTDRRWDGLGLYAEYARRALSKVRDEYLGDRHLVAVRDHIVPLRIGPDGLHVRVRPGSPSIPDHLYGCPITVEHVDLPSQADVEAAWKGVEPVVDRLRSEQPGCISGWGPGHIRVEAWAVPVAEELHRRFGDLVELQVGARRYPPPSRHPSVTPRGSTEQLIPDEVTVELDGPAVVKSGHTLVHDLLVHNPTGRDVWLAFGNRNTVVVDPQTGEVVGGYSGMVTLPLHIRRVPPEQSGRVSLLIGTDSFLPRLGYAVPPGEWGVQGLLRVIPDTRGPDRPMVILPPDSPHQPMPVPPDTRGPDQRTPILPLIITA